MPSLFPDLFVFEQFAPLILRLVFGAVFIVHGYPKLFTQFAETAQFFEAVNIRPAKFLVFVVGIVEFFGGIFLVAGFLTQLVAALIAIDMMVAIWKVKFRQGFFGGYEFDLALLAMAVSLILLGPGKFSLDLPF